MKLSKDKVLLVLGGGHEQLQGIIEAKKLGFKIFCIDKNNKCEAKNISEKFFNFSITKVSKIEAVLKKYNINLMTSFCSDLALKSISYFGNRIRNNPLSLDLTNIFTNKFLMKNFFRRNGIDTPEFILHKNEIDTKKFLKKIKFPVVIKPSDSFGQKGVNKIRQKKELFKSILNAKKFSITNQVILEKFIKGFEVNIVAIVFKNKLKILSISDRITYTNHGFGIAYEHRYPSKISLKQHKEIEKILNKIILRLKINNIVLYPQLIITPKKIYVIEIASRVPGGYMRELSMLASGIDPIKFQLYLLIGNLKNLNEINSSVKKKSIYIRFFTKKNTKSLKKFNSKNIMQASKIKGIYNIFINRIKKIPNINDSSSRFGSIISYGKNFEIAKDCSNKALKFFN